ncbi:MAG: hypothetical protein ABEJ88_00845 [Halobacterium sp.]
MPDSEPVQCPVCGWTGTSDDLGGTDGEPACPTCGEPLGAVA